MNLLGYSAARTRKDENWRKFVFKVKLWSEKRIWVVRRFLFCVSWFGNCTTRTRAALEYSKSNHTPNFRARQWRSWWWWCATLLFKSSRLDGVHFFSLPLLCVYSYQHNNMGVEFLQRLGWKWNGRLHFFFSSPPISTTNFSCSYFFLLISRENFFLRENF